MAEAYCAIGKVDEALVLLQPHLSLHKSTTSIDPLEYSHTTSTIIENFPKWWFSDKNQNQDLLPKVPSSTPNGDPLSLPSMCGLIVKVNYAATLAMQGSTTSLKEAQTLLTEVMTISPLVIKPAVRLLTYVLLVMGKSNEALALLRGNR